MQYSARESREAIEPDWFALLAPWLSGIVQAAHESEQWIRKAPLTEAVQNHIRLICMPVVDCLSIYELCMNKGRIDMSIVVVCSACS